MTDEVLFFATLFFAFSVTLPEMIRRDTDDYHTEAVSHYLTGPASGLQDIGFVVMALGMFWAAAQWWLSTSAVAAILVGIGLIGAMTTDRFPQWYGSQKKALHGASAGLAFLSAAVMMIALPQPKGMLTLAIAYPVVVALAYVLAPKRTAVQEKLAVAMIVIWLLGLSV